MYPRRSLYRPIFCDTEESAAIRTSLHERTMGVTERAAPMMGVLFFGMLDLKGVLRIPPVACTGSRSHLGGVSPKALAEIAEREKRAAKAEADKTEALKTLAEKELDNERLTSEVALKEHELKFGQSPSKQVR